MTGFFAVTQFAVDTLESRDGRALAFNEQIEYLGRERTRQLRREQELQQGRMLTPLAEETRGDVVMVMVDAGEGERVKTEIYEMLRGGA